MLLTKRILILIATLCFGCSLCAAQDVANILRGRVVSIDDGNTLVVLADNKKIRVRLVGTDVPSQALSKQSRENLTSLARDKDVSVLLAPVEIQEGKHKLALGKVSAGELDAGLEQIRGGFAWQSKKFKEHQTQADIALYSEAEKGAVEAKLGVWGEGFSTCKDAAVKTTVDSGAKPRPKDTNIPNVYGTVYVEITVDEGGDVVSVRAICGHPVLQTVAARTALRAKYKPQSTRITGTVVYNFVPDYPPSTR